jgi:hypothetical protein
MWSRSVSRLPVIRRRAVSRRLGPIALCLAAACGTDGRGTDGPPPIVGSATPCRFQEWTRARELASNPELAAALAPVQFAQVPSAWLPLADGSGYFIAIKFDGTAMQDGVVVVFTCDGQLVLTERFGPSTWISSYPFGGFQPKDSSPTYLTVQATRGDPGRERSVVKYYRFYRNRLSPVGELVNREVVLEDSVNGIEEVASSEWRADQPGLIQRCVETRRTRRDPATGSWRPDSGSRRTVAQAYRLEGDKLRLVSRADGCRR